MSTIDITGSPEEAPMKPSPAHAAWRFPAERQSINEARKMLKSPEDWKFELLDESFNLVRDGLSEKLFLKSFLFTAFTLMLDQGWKNNLQWYKSNGLYITPQTSFLRLNDPSLSIRPVCLRIYFLFQACGVFGIFSRPGVLLIRCFFPALCRD